MNRTLVCKTLFILALVGASVFAIVRTPVRLGLDLRGGASLILRVKVDDAASPEQKRDVVEQTRQILERRINAYGLSEAPVQPYGSRGNELLAQLPGISDTARIEKLLKNRGVLEWYAVEDGPYANPVDAMAQHPGIGPDNRKLGPRKPAADGRSSCDQLGRPPIVRGTDLRDARMATDSMKQPVTTFI